MNQPLGGACTISNTLQLLNGTITVNKDFVPDSTATVSVSLACTSGIVTTTPLAASETAPAVFNVTGASPGATCTASETVPFGYAANQAGCQTVAIGGSCTIINTLSVAAAPTIIPSGSRLTLLLLASVLALLGLFTLRSRAG